MALGSLPEAQRLFGESLRIAQRLAESDPANAVWQADPWVSCWRVANAMDNQQSPDANMYCRIAYDTLAAMEKAGLVVSPQDQ